MNAALLAGRCLALPGQVAGLMMQNQHVRTSLILVDNYMLMPVEHFADKNLVLRPYLKGSIEFRNVGLLRDILF